MKVTANSNSLSGPHATTPPAVRILNVIDNNTSTTIGGGSNSNTANQRASVAPPFIP